MTPRPCTRPDGGRGKSLLAWQEEASLTWYGPYADRDQAGLGRERIQRGASWRKLRLVGFRHTADGYELFDLKRERATRQATKAGER